MMSALHYEKYINLNSFATFLYKNHDGVLELRVIIYFMDGIS